MLQGYKVYVKVDQRSVTEGLSELVLRPGKPLHILIQDELSRSKEMEVLKMIVRNKT